MQDKQLLTVTLAEFIEALREGIGLSAFSSEVELTASSHSKHYIYGMKELANLLGCSVSTAHRIKKSGVINEAIAQNGKVIVIDADLAIDLMKCKRYKRYRA